MAVRCSALITPDNKAHGANMGPVCGRQDKGGPHVGPMNFAIWDLITAKYTQFDKEIKHKQCNEIRLF